MTKDILEKLDEMAVWPKGSCCFPDWMEGADWGDWYEPITALFSEAAAEIRRLREIEK